VVCVLEWTETGADWSLWVLLHESEIFKPPWRKDYKLCPWEGCSCFLRKCHFRFQHFECETCKVFRSRSTSSTHCMGNLLAPSPHSLFLPHSSHRHHWPSSFITFVYVPLMHITHCGAAWCNLSYVISLAENWNIKRNNLIHRPRKWSVASFHNPNTSNTFSHIWSGCGPCRLLYDWSIYIMTWTNWPTKPTGDLSITFSLFCLVSAFSCIKWVLIGICRRVNHHHHHHDSSDQSECWLAIVGGRAFWYIILWE